MRNDGSDLNAEAERLGREHALGKCTKAWLGTGFLLRCVFGGIVLGCALISLIASLLPADRNLGLVVLALIALPIGALLLVIPPRSRRLRLYLFEGGAVRASNVGPGPRLVVLPWADLVKITPRFDGDGDLTSCVLRGRSGTRLTLGRPEDMSARDAILQAAQQALAAQSPGVLGFGVPVIGVAKTPFASATHAIPVPDALRRADALARGRSNNYSS
ncbi:MAG TPA: hypothetical protein VMU95_11470 [Trebonia sp.]|nr:hypothetical protein [Trebonia sp.]